ncbi:hypothetical protein [Isoptericola croceus]|uniref:hypothetical protein n=1 Tax=Isoptericola croceus TaxID=3031406 RepID=UPI0023F748F5|nr:hypothetical protein [Isoptericola croceus]
MRALVLGARGAVGRHAVAALRRGGHTVTPAGRTGADGGAPVDLEAPDGVEQLRRAAVGHDVVLDASGVENPAIVSGLGGAGLVDISATGRYLAQLQAGAPAGASVVRGAGLVPGLSTVLVTALDTRAGDEIDVTVMLGTGEKHGRAAVAWTVGLVGAPVHDPPEGGEVRNLRTTLRSAGPDGRRRTYLRADFGDHVLVPDRVVRTWLTFSSRTATGVVALVGRAGRGGWLISSAPALGSADWSLQVSVRRTGQRLAATGRGQSRATGVLAALAAERVADQQPGRCVTMADLVTVDDALDALAAAAQAG